MTSANGRTQLPSTRGRPQMTETQLTPSGGSTGRHRSLVKMDRSVSVHHFRQLEYDRRQVTGDGDDDDFDIDPDNERHLNDTNSSGGGGGSSKNHQDAIMEGSSTNSKVSASSSTQPLNQPPPSNNNSKGGGAAAAPIAVVPGAHLMDESGKCQTVWEYVSRFFTCCFPSLCLKKCCHMGDESVRQAWREKVSLCLMSFLLCVFLGYFTFFLQSSSCPQRPNTILKYSDAVRPNFLRKGRGIVNGFIYDFEPWFSASHPPIAGVNMTELAKRLNGRDLSPMFTQDSPDCVQLFGANVSRTANLCKMEGITYCHGYSALNKIRRVGSVYFEWKDITGSKFRGTFSRDVFDLGPLFAIPPGENNTISSNVVAKLRTFVGRDCTKMIYDMPTEMHPLGKCLVQMYGIGPLEEDPAICIAANTILTMALVIICGLVVIRFSLAIAFAFFMSWQLGKIEQSRSLFGAKKKESQMVTAATHPQNFSIFSRIDFSLQYREIYTICLVTCYSEGLEGLKTTMDSLAETDYDDEYKLIFVVADGIVKGAGNNKPTGDIVLDMINLDAAIHGDVERVPMVDPKTNEIILDPVTKEPLTRISCMNDEPQSYRAIGSGSKEHNMARIYCGTYNVGDRHCPIILVYKCGTPAEADQGKPGNRGKRDSQIVLMDFLSKIMFNERLSPLQYDLFMKWMHIMTVQNGSTRRVTPDMFEIVLMVDADTKVMSDSLTRMVAVMQRDPYVMGLCGETKIMNKSENFVTAMQVFEYYVSHHLAKAFESVFGGVTCLPGCFCMYRIKAPKPIGKDDERWRHSKEDPENLCNWVPVLVNPDIVYDYSASTVSTLHKKNLLLLGEDRYLTTLMLRTFPKRKMMFVPKAICKTQVPNSFKILLSQRRRWINSTIHNLMELILVNELCGIFCFSMQFVVFLELIGTVTLPAAILFTSVLLGSSIYSAIVGQAIPWVPLLLLAAILILPAILIFFTTRKFVYALYLFSYLAALPAWNFILPVYAFWHFDDFSWGQTRQVDGEKKGGDSHGHGGGDAVSSVGTISLKKWHEWERIWRKALQMADIDDPICKITRQLGPKVKVERKKKFSFISLLSLKSGSTKGESKNGTPNTSRPASAAGELVSVHGGKLVGSNIDGSRNSSSRPQSQLIPVGRPKPGSARLRSPIQADDDDISADAPQAPPKSYQRPQTRN